MDEAFEAEKARQARLQDIADYNNETAGVETGRALHFSTKEEFQRRAAKAKGEDPAPERALTTLLLQRLADPAYREVWERVGEELNMADRASLIALEKARQHQAEAERALQELQERAARLPDGRRVYRTEDGTAAYDESNNRLTEAQMAQVPWEEGQPTWEQRNRGFDDVQAASRDVRDTEAYRERLHEIQQRHAAGEMSKDELEDLDKNFEADMPESVRRHYEAEKSIQPPRHADHDQSALPDTGSVASHVLADTGLTAAKSARAAFTPAAAGTLTSDEFEKAAATVPAPTAPRFG